LLSECDITKSDLLKGFYFLENRRDVIEELHRLVYGHVEHIIDRLSFIPDLQCFPVIAFSVTRFALHIHIRQEVHFNKLEAGPLAGFATSALYVE